MKIVMNFSGGLDSTYLAWKILSTTTDELTGFFINTTSMPGSWVTKFDMRAFSDNNPEYAMAAANWLQQNVRPFSFVNHDIEDSYLVRGFGNVNSPQVYLARYATPRINTSEYDKVVCTSEKENDGWSNGGTIDSRRPGAFAARDWFVANATRGSVEFPLIASDYTQAVALLEMPKGLSSLVDVCSVQDQSFKCKKRRWLQAQLDEGKTPQEIYALWYQKCTVYQGRWFSMKWWIDGALPTENNTWPMPAWPTSYSL